MLPLNPELIVSLGTLVMAHVRTLPDERILLWGQLVIASTLLCVHPT